MQDTTEQTPAPPTIPSHIYPYIKGEIKNWGERVLRYTPSADKHFERLLHLVDYLLGSEADIPKEIGAQESYGSLLQTLLTSLRFPANIAPIKQITTGGPHRITNFWDAFMISPQISIMGSFFSIVQKNILAHLAPRQESQVTAVPVTHLGLPLGVVFYFPDPTYTDINTRSNSRPLDEQTVRNDTEELYRALEDDPRLPGGFLVYLYSVEDNAYYMSGNKLPAAKLFPKSFVKKLREDISDAYSRQDWDTDKPGVTMSPFQPSTVIEQQIVNLTKLASSRIWDTRKYYVNKFIQKKLSAEISFASYTTLYDLLFEFVTELLPSAGAILWTKKKNAADWHTSKYSHYSIKDVDQDIYRALKSKPVFSHTKLYNLSNRETALPEEPTLNDLTPAQENSITMFFHYAPNTAKGSPTIICKSHLQIPLINIDKHFDTDAVLEIFFSAPAHNLETVKYDIVRMIHRSIRIAKDEFKVQKSLRRASHAEAKAFEYRAQAHEVKNLIPFIKKETPASILGSISRYFATLFAVSKEEAKLLKAGELPSSLPDSFAEGDTLTSFVTAALKIALQIEHSIRLCNNIGSCGFEKKSDSEIGDLLRKTVKKDLERCSFAPLKQKEHRHLTDKISQLGLYKKWYLCSALVVAFRNVIQHSSSNYPIEINVDTRQNQIAILNRKKIRRGRTEGATQAKAWPGSTGEAIQFCVDQYHGQMVKDGFLIQAGWHDKEENVYLYKSLIPLPETFKTR